MNNAVFCATRSGKRLLERVLKYLAEKYDDVNKTSIEIVDFDLIRFPNSEFKVVGLDNLREKVVHLVTSIRQECPDINVSEDTWELFQMMDSIQRAGAAKLIVYFGYLPWQRQEKKKPKESITAKLFFNLLYAASPKILSRVCSVNLHSPALQGFIDLPFDVVSTLPLHILFFKKNLIGKKFIAVSNDEGRADIIREFATYSGADGTVIMKKRRDLKNDPTTNILDGRDYIKEYEYFVIGDDEISSGDSMINTYNILKSMNPNAKIFGFSDHGLFNIKNNISAEEKFYNYQFPIFTTDTIPRSQDYYDTAHKWLTVASVGPYLADLVYCIQHSLSFSKKYAKHLHDAITGKAIIDDYLIPIDPKEFIAK